MSASAVRLKYIRSNEFRVGETDFWCSVLLKPSRKSTVKISLHLAAGLHDDETKWNRLFQVLLAILPPDGSELVDFSGELVRLHYVEPTYGKEEFAQLSDVADCNAIYAEVRLLDDWKISSATAGQNPGMYSVNFRWCVDYFAANRFLVDEKEDLVAPFFYLVEGLLCGVALRIQDESVFAVVKTYQSPADSCLIFGVMSLRNGDYQYFDGRASTKGEFAVRLMDYSMWNSDETLVNYNYQLRASFYYLKDSCRSEKFKEDGNWGVQLTWKIKNLAEMKDTIKKDKGRRNMNNLSAKSEIFYVGSCAYWLALYPRGKDNQTHVSIYLEACYSDKIAPLFARISVRLLNHKNQNRSLANEIQSDLDTTAGWEQFISMERFFDPDVGFYKQGEVVLILRIQVLPKESLADESIADDSLPEESLVKDDSQSESMKVSEGDSVALEMPPAQQKGLYIVLISLPGLIRGENMELGRDSDTGAQVKYVVELARALGASPGVHRVDLLTRKVTAPGVHRSYSVSAEKLNMQADGNDGQEHGGAYIIRIPFGPTNKYLEKEQLWPHISEFVDRALCHVLHISKILGEEIGGGQEVRPAIIHGHYADAGDAAALLSGVLNVPMLFTGHSLGRGKLEQLLEQGRFSKEYIDSTYRIMRQIESEELCLDASEMIIASTTQEVDNQWSLYDGFDPKRMTVISPCMEPHHIVPHDADLHADKEAQEECNATPDPPIWSEIMRFLNDKDKPMILALSSLEPIKNLTTLVKAYGECQSLREHANLILITGNRKDIKEMSKANASVLTSVLLLIEQYDLYGHVAYPKHHKLSDIPDIYRLAAKTKGVFINPALIEPSGLTSIEAAACGLPTVATRNGCDVIIETLKNGLLIDPHNQQSIAEALLKLVGDENLRERYRQNGWENICQYSSWTKHSEDYLSLIARYIPDTGDEVSKSDSPGLSMNLKLSSEEDKTIIATAVEEAKSVAGHQQVPVLQRREHIFVMAVDSDETSIQIIKSLFQICSDQKNAGSIGFILSTALTISEVESLFASANVSLADFDAFICNSGGELYYPSTNTEGSSTQFTSDRDVDYHSHIEYRWGGEDLRKALVELSEDKKTEDGGQIFVLDESTSTDCCYTFKVNALAWLPSNKEFRKLLRNHDLRCHPIYCQTGTRVNVIPVLASRSQALRYLYLRKGMELTKFVVVVGEYGDTDYEGLLGGVLKTIVLKGVSHDSRKLHTNRSYPLDHVMPYDSTNMVKAEGCEAEALKAVLCELAILEA